MHLRCDRFAKKNKLNPFILHASIDVSSLLFSSTPIFFLDYPMSSSSSFFMTLSVFYHYPWAPFSSSYHHRAYQLSSASSSITCSRALSYHSYRHQSIACDLQMIMNLHWEYYSPSWKQEFNGLRMNSAYAAWLVVLRTDAKCLPLHMCCSPTCFEGYDAWIRNRQGMHTAACPSCKHGWHLINPKHSFD